MRREGRLGFVSSLENMVDNLPPHSGVFIGRILSRPQIMWHPLTNCAAGVIRVMCIQSRRAWLYPRPYLLTSC